MELKVKTILSIIDISKQDAQDLELALQVYCEWAQDYSEHEKSAERIGELRQTLAILAY